MAEAIQMIALSPTMNEGTIAQWLVAEGQDIKSGAALCEVETDKATMTYEAPMSGRILKILLPAGSSASVGQIIAVAGKPGEDWQQVVAAETGRSPVSGSPVSGSPVSGSPEAGAEVKTAALPELASSQASQRSQPETSVASTQAVPAPQAAAAAPSAAVPSGFAQPGITDTARAGTLVPSGNPPSSPLARNKARAAGIDLRTLRGSGPGGRIIARDIEAEARLAAPRPLDTRPAGAGLTVTPQSKAKTVQPQAGLRGDSQAVSRMRGIIAQRLSESYREAPHYLVRSAIDMERLLELRAKVNADREEKISLNAFIIKLTARALEAQPILNSSWLGNTIQYKDSADIGLAVAVEGGLITPVVRHCERKGVLQIHRELSDLIARSRTGGLLPEEYSGASFTVSNLGMYGVEEFSAIINPPGVAILALGAVQDEAVVRDKQICVRPILHATLSADHRAVDGAVAAAYLMELKKLAEEPALALL